MPGYRIFSKGLWTATALALSAGVLGWHPGFVLAMALTAVHAIAAIEVESSLVTLPVQVRVFFLLLLVALSPEPLHILYWLPALGAWIRVLFDYCIMARLLVLMPWNRTQPCSVRLVMRAFDPAIAPRS